MNGKKQIAAYVPTRKHTAFAKYAKLSGRNVSQQVEFLVDCALAGVIELPASLAPIKPVRIKKVSSERRAA